MIIELILKWGPKGPVKPRFFELCLLVIGVFLWIFSNLKNNIRFFPKKFSTF